jgi:UDP-N-acetylglucosamine 3-dehydrogenase
MGGTNKGILGIGVVGCGGIAHAHLRAIGQEPRVELIAVADTDSERAQACAAKYGSRAVHASWDALYEEPGIDAVVLCLPHDVHAPAAIRALESGKHVLVEKPIATTLDDADAMIEAAGRAGRVLMVGHMTRFRRTTVAMQRSVASGAIGEPVSFETIYYGPREIMPSIPWVMRKASGGGGPLAGFGTHHVDVLHWLFGDVAAVSCFTSRGVLREAEVEDTAAIALRFQCGVIGVIHFTWARSVDRYDEQFHIFGSQGEVICRGTEAVSLASEPRFGDRTLHALDPAVEAPDVVEDAFAGELAHFVECVRTGATPLTDGPGARRALVVIEAGYTSAELGQTIAVHY